MATIYESLLSTANKISAEATNVEEALKSVPVYLDSEGNAIIDDFGMAFTAEGVDMHIVNPDSDSVVEGMVDNNGTSHTDGVHNYQCIVMKHNKKQLGVMTKAYTIVQNKEAFAFVDNMKGIANIKMSYGKVTHTGAHCVVLDAPEVEILGEKFIPHIILRNSFNGRYKVSAVMQLESVNDKYILSFGRNVISTRHLKNVNVRLLQAKNTIANLYNWIGNIQDLAKDLNQKSLTEFQIKKILNHYFPTSAEDAKRSNKATIDAKKEEFLAMLGDKATAWDMVKTYFRWASTKFFGGKKNESYTDDIFCNLMDKTDYDYMLDMIDADLSKFGEIKVNEDYEIPTEMVEL